MTVGLAREQVGTRSVRPDRGDDAPPTPGTRARSGRAPRTRRPDPWLGGRLRRTVVSRLVVLQLVAVLTLVLGLVDRSLAVLGALILVVTLVVVLGRWHGRSVTQLVAALASLRARRHRLTALAAAGAGPLTLLLPTVELGTWTDRAGTVFAVARQRRSLWVVLGLVPEDHVGLLRSARPVGVALTSLWGSFAAEPSVAACRLLLHSVPAGAGSSGPARRLAWVSLRVDDAGSDDEARARGGGLVGAQRLLVREAARLAVRVAEQGVHAKALDPDEMRAAAAVAGGLAAAAGDTADPLEETWSACRVGHRSHRTYWLARWPRHRPLPDVVELLSAVDADSVSVSVESARPVAGRLPVRVVLRVTADGDRSSAVEAELAALDKRHGLRLVRLDGRHAQGFALTMPFGEPT